METKIANANLLVKKVFVLEELLLKAFGRRFGLVAEVIVNETTKKVAVEMTHDYIQTGADLGLLGRSIYRVDFNLYFTPDADGTKFYASIDLRYRHLSGGSNGVRLGKVIFDPERRDGDFQKGHFDVIPDEIR